MSDGITRCVRGQTSPGNELFQLPCRWQPSVHHKLRCRRTVQTLRQFSDGQIPVDLAARTDTARADTTERRMQQTLRKVQSDQRNLSLK